MPAYNAQAFIRQSLQSVLAQTFEDFGLIVVNDGSTDDTAAILAAFDDPSLQGLLQHRIASRLRLQGILSRLRLANTITLTPEGVSAAEQIELIDAMIRRGCRTFALHYHSPTLAKQTPYVRTEADLAAFIGRIEAVCRHFFAVRGGMPGNPADLLPPGQRSRLWPAKITAAPRPLANSPTQ